MGVRILHDSEAEMAALYCSTTETAFGPLFHATGSPHYIDADEMANQFLTWLKIDARTMTDELLSESHAEFLETFDREGPFWEKDEATDE